MHRSSGDGRSLDLGPRILGSCLALAMLVATVVTSAPVHAMPRARVVPVDGKWAGLRTAAVCMRMPAEDTTPNALPTGTCPNANIELDDEDVMFTLSHRHITSMSFDIPLQCRASDVNEWTALTMTYRTTAEFGYAGLDGTTQIPVGGRLRIAFPIQGSPLMYPDGTVRATFDFRRGPKPTVAIFYKGTETDADTRITTTCVSDQNRPSLIAVQLLAR